jgi:virulence factor Mce-like protein
MKRILLSACILLGAGAFILLAAGASSGNPAGTYKIELDNAFGIVTGADFKVAGVPVGTIDAINLDQKTLDAVVTVSVNRGGFGSFHADAFCQSRPQSLIGEYFIDCNPGTSGKVLPPGSTIPVTHTESTIPADLLQDVMRMPYRERLTLIINELGAAAAARSGDLQAALQRAVPALTETDSLLNLLANDSATLQSLTRDSGTVVTALADNTGQVERFITEANNVASDTATQQGNLKLTLHKLPGVLQQLQPAMVKLGGAVTANQPVVDNLNAASGQINRLLTDLPSFSHSARPALKSLGQASVTGRTAVLAAKPTVAALNMFAKPAPELAQNLAIVLNDLDTQSRAVERDSRSPGGKGFSGLQALLGYVFNQTLAINAYGPLGHFLAVDAFFSKMCSPYATPATVAMALKTYGSRYRQCYSWLGPNQPGVNETDPSDPGAAVPDPGGAPPGETAPRTSAAKLTVADLAKQTSTASFTNSPTTATTATTATSTTTGTTATSTTTGTTATSTATGTTATTTGTGTTASRGAGTDTSRAGGSTGAGSAGSAGTTSTPASTLHSAVGAILSLLGGGSSSAGRTAAASGASDASSSTGTGSSGSSGSASGGQTQALLNYLLAP